jgi:hypothetical protein
MWASLSAAVDYYTVAADSPLCFRNGTTRMRPKVSKAVLFYSGSWLRHFTRFGRTLEGVSAPVTPGLHHIMLTWWIYAADCDPW